MYVQVRYADGDVENLFLAAGCERVRLQIHPGEVFQPPDAEQLHNRSQLFLEASRQMAASACNRGSQLSQGHMSQGSAIIDESLTISLITNGKIQRLLRVSLHTLNSIMSS